MMTRATLINSGHTTGPISHYGLFFSVTFESQITITSMERHTHILHITNGFVHRAWLSEYDWAAVGNTAHARYDDSELPRPPLPVTGVYSVVTLRATEGIYRAWMEVYMPKRWKRHRQIEQTTTSTYEFVSHVRDAAGRNRVVVIVRMADEQCTHPAHIGPDDVVLGRLKTRWTDAVTAWVHSTGK